MLEPLELRDWMIIGGLSLIPAVVGQTVKNLRTRAVSAGVYGL